MEVKMLALHNTNAMVKPGNAIEETNADFPFKAHEKLSCGVNRDVDFVLENHSIRTKIPTGVVIRIKDVISENSKL